MMVIGETYTIGVGNHTATIVREVDSGPFRRYRMTGVLIGGNRDLYIDVFFTGDGIIHEVESSIYGGVHPSSMKGFAALCEVAGETIFADKGDES